MSRVSDFNVRRRMRLHALWGVANNKAIHYSEARPYQNCHHRCLPLTADCSSWVTLCARWGGAPDPNGNGYDGIGFTGTLLNHLRHITRPEARRGDFVVFGKYPGTHVVVLVQSARRTDNPLCVSHGFEGGPILIRLQDEAKYHSGQAMTFLQVV